MVPSLPPVVLVDIFWGRRAILAPHTRLLLTLECARQRMRVGMGKRQEPRVPFWSSTAGHGWGCWARHNRDCLGVAIGGIACICTIGVGHRAIDYLRTVHSLQARTGMHVTADIHAWTGTSIIHVSAGTGQHAGGCRLLIVAIVAIVVSARASTGRSAMHLRWHRGCMRQVGSGCGSFRAVCACTPTVARCSRWCHKRCQRRLQADVNLGELRHGTLNCKRRQTSESR